MCRGLFEKLLAVGQKVPEKTEKTVFSFLKERNTVGCVRQDSSDYPRLMAYL
jgi:hypothetical protein